MRPDNNRRTSQHIQRRETSFFEFGLPTPPRMAYTLGKITMTLFWSAAFCATLATYLLLGIAMGFVGPVADNWTVAAISLLLGLTLLCFPSPRRTYPRASKIILGLIVLEIIGFAGFWILIIAAFSEVGIGR